MNRLMLSLITVSALTAACASKKKSSETAAGPETTTKVTKETTTTTKKTETSSASNGAVMSKADCTNKSDKRVLEVRERGKGCELGYTKNGQEAVVATSMSGSAHCNATFEKIKGRLAEAGFNCN